MSEKNEQSAERCAHIKLGRIDTDLNRFRCFRCGELLDFVEQPAASPAQLSAIEFKLNGFSLLEILGRHFGQTAMVKYELVPEVAAWAEAYRDASQPQSVSEEQLQKAVRELEVLEIMTMYPEEDANCNRDELLESLRYGLRKLLTTLGETK